jgi:hypothetical protein
MYYVSERASVDHGDRWVIHSQLSLRSMRIEVANRHHQTSMGGTHSTASSITLAVSGASFVLIALLILVLVDADRTTEDVDS